MEKTSAETPPFAKVHHVGVVVKDMKKTVAHYESLGLGHFEALKLSPAEGFLRGKSLVSTPIISMGEVGGIIMELLQPTEDESLIKEFYEARGEGIHHIAFLVEDIDRETEHLLRRGYKVLFNQKFGKGGCAFFDTGQVGGVWIELFCPPV